MRALKYAILGLLNQKSLTGYELSKVFTFELGEFWYASHSQIYPELKKLHEEGKVTFDVEITGDILETKRYTITEKGKKDFSMWLHTDEKIIKTPKDPFRLRMYFAHNLDCNARLHLLDNQKMQHIKRLNMLKKNFEVYNVVPPIDSDRFGDFLVLRGAILREEQTLNWLNECIGYCNEAMENK